MKVAKGKKVTQIVIMKVIAQTVLILTITVAKTTKARKTHSTT